MKPLSRVVWSEGMHLAQHHFQVQSRYFEGSIEFALSHLFFKAYGVVGIELDAEALRNGTISVVHARGVMPDGTAFHFPDADVSPPALEIRELFSPTADAHVVRLTIPAYRPGQANCGTSGDGTSGRYVAETRSIPDEITGLDEKPVSLGRKNFRLTLDSQADEGMVTLPLARVRRDGAGHFIYDPEYVPPCLQIGASTRLLQLLTRLVEMLDGKSQALSQTRAADGKTPGEYAANDVANFWLLHSILSSLAPLRHHLAVRRSRPELVYGELARLAGALCTFALDSHPRTLPLYDHDNLGETFKVLEHHVRTHLDIIVPSTYVSIPLQRSQDYLFVGQVTDQRCLGPSVWFLGVRSSLGEAQVASLVPRLVKVCSERHIIRLVKEAFPGLTLEPVRTAPAAIAPRPGTQYFSIVRTGPCWEAIAKSGGIGIYFPEPLLQAEVELRILPQA